MEGVLLSLIEAGCIVTLLIFVGDFFWASRGYRGSKRGHFDGKRFVNIGWSKKSSLKLEKNEDGKGSMFMSFLKWMLTRRRKHWKKREIQPSTPNMREDGVRITLVGHATVLIQAYGVNILTDPVWSNRVSPLSWLGPKRYTQPGIAWENLPPIDIVLISHNHYDHMDVATLQKLHKRDAPRIYTGLGNKKYLMRYGIDAVEEMDWWDEKTWDGATHVTFVPAQHFSARGITDRNKTLWGGFILRIHGMSLYFAGDTGYGEFLEDIKRHFPHPIDIGLLPIGAYKPSWFMAPVHTNPEEALQIQKDLAIKTAIGIHYGTFALADDDQDEPIEDLKKAQENESYRMLAFRVGPSGSSWRFD